MTTIAPYGSWPTRLTPELLASGNLRLSYPTILPDRSLAWLEGRAAEKGRQVVVVEKAGGACVDLLPAPFNARTRVHEYGGLPFAFDGAGILFSNDVDQHVYRSENGGDPVVLTSASGFRFAELTHDAAQGRWIAVGERHEGSGQPENGLVTIDARTGEAHWLVRGHDFFASPALSPSGRELAYLAWDHPFMPWDAASLWVVPIADDGTTGHPVHVAGGPDGSAFQPLWSPRGELFFALESSTTPWAIHRRTSSGIARVSPIGAEWGAPLWNLGTSLYGFRNERELIGAVSEEGFSRVVRVDVETGAMETVSDAFASIGQLAVRGDDVLFTVGWAGSGSRVVHLDAATGKTRIVRDALAAVLREDVIAPGDVPAFEAIRFETTGGDHAFGFFHPPTSSRFSGPDGELPPLMVLCHGGPTGNAVPAIQPAILYWTNQGFAVLDVNYRGSTGFGRAYREKLRGLWGAVDVDDCVHGALALALAGRVDRKRLLIRGGSAGGFTLLLALAKYPGVFAAAACLYGVTDPRTLAHETHKFESHYDRFLFGDAEARERAFVERSPIALVDQIDTPVIFFHGLEDKAVLPAQSEALHDALARRSVLTERHVYAGEQHGFRKAETIRDVYERERAFYARVTRTG